MSNDDFTQSDLHSLAHQGELKPDHDTGEGEADVDIVPDDSISPETQKHNLTHMPDHFQMIGEDGQVIADIDEGDAEGTAR